jgi:hypothetical protein
MEAEIESRTFVGDVLARWGLAARRAGQTAALAWGPSHEFRPVANQGVQLPDCGWWRRNSLSHHPRIECAPVMRGLDHIAGLKFGCQMVPPIPPLLRRVS